MTVCVCMCVRAFVRVFALRKYVCEYLCGAHNARVYVCLCVCVCVCVCAYNQQVWAIVVVRTRLCVYALCACIGVPASKIEQGTGYSVIVPLSLTSSFVTIIPFTPNVSWRHLSPSSS